MTVYAVMDEMGLLVTLFLDESEANEYVRAMRGIGWYVVERFAQ
jgi:hypothetical protein